MAWALHHMDAEFTQQLARLFARNGGTAKPASILQADAADIDAAQIRAVKACAIQYRFTQAAFFKHRLSKITVAKDGLGKIDAFQRGSAKAVAGDARVDQQRFGDVDLYRADFGQVRAGQFAAVEMRGFQHRAAKGGVVEIARHQPRLTQLGRGEVGEGPAARGPAGVVERRLGKVGFAQITIFKHPIGEVESRQIGLLQITADQCMRLVGQAFDIGAGQRLVAEGVGRKQIIHGRTVGQGAPMHHPDGDDR